MMELTRRRTYRACPSAKTLLVPFVFPPLPLAPFSRMVEGPRRVNFPGLRPMRPRIPSTRFPVRRTSPISRVPVTRSSLFLRPRFRFGTGLGPYERDCERYTL